jgi:ketosteroid isomerase-like protein
MLAMRQLTSIVLLLTAAGCSRAPFDTVAESKKLLARDAEWAVTAAQGKDVDKITSYWSDDAVIIPQGQPVVEGKAAIRAYVANSLQIPGFKIHWVSSNATFSPDGKLAYVRSTNEITVPGPTGAPQVMAGRGITVWRMESDGQWRCVIDIWNDPPTAAAN